MNVFPVADGDTGDNMALTLHAVIEALASIDGREVDEGGRQAIVDAVAHAALMGARGNSGVILSEDSRAERPRFSPSARASWLTRSSCGLRC